MTVQSGLCQTWSKTPKTGFSGVATHKVVDLLVNAICFHVAETDPCSEDIYKTLPRAAYRGGACPYNRDKQTCDAALITGWYRAMVNGKNLKMQESPASLSSCGTKWPLWMNGKVFILSKRHYYNVNK